MSPRLQGSGASAGACRYRISATGRADDADRHGFGKYLGTPGSSSSKKRRKKSFFGKACRMAIVEPGKGHPLGHQS